MGLFRKPLNQNNLLIWILRDLLEICGITGPVRGRFQKTFSLTSAPTKAKSLNKSISFMKERRFAIIKRLGELKKIIVSSIQEYKELEKELNKLKQMLKL